MLATLNPEVLFTTNFNNLGNNNLSTAQFTSHVNPQTSYLVYGQYRTLAMALVNVDSPEIFYKTYFNEQNSHNGDGVHEKYIYQGQAILDLSVGVIDFPWFAADANPFNEISNMQLQQMAANEMSLVVAPRLRAIADFMLLQPPFTRLYYYSGTDGVRSLTVSDEFNGVKMNVILTHGETLLNGF